MQDFTKKLFRKIIPYLYIFPALILYILFLIYPILNTIRYSFTDWDGIQPVKNFVGLDNYINAINDRQALMAFSNNIGWLIVGTIVPVLGGLILAELLSTKIKGRTFFRTIYFMPAVLSLLVVGIIWGWIYNPTYGIINKILGSIGLDILTHNWLGDPKTALWATIISGVWTWFGICTTIFLAGMQSINMELYNAAMIDGANAVQRFFHITIPELRHVITMVTSITLIGGFKVFDLIYVMTKGGPANLTEVIATYIYKVSFRFHEIGYGSALATILCVIVLTGSYFFLHMREKGER